MGRESDGEHLASVLWGKNKGMGGGGKYREHRERSGVMLSHEPGCVRKPEAALRPLPSRNDGRKIS